MERVKLPKVALPKVSLPKAVLSGHKADAVTRNLLLGSNRVIESSVYNIANYPHKGTLKAGDKVTVTIWGELGEGKTKWGVYNSNAAPNNMYNEIDYNKQWIEKNGVYILQSEWLINPVTGNDNLRIYAVPNNIDSVSRIDRIKLELGWNDNPVWSPAPEDKYGLPTTLELMCDDYPIIE